MARSAWTTRGIMAGLVCLAGAAALLTDAWVGSPALSWSTLAAAAAAAAFAADRWTRDSPALAELRHAIAALQRGDTRQRLDPERMGSLAGEARALNDLSKSLAGSARRLLELNAQLSLVPEEIAAALGGMEEGAHSQEAAVEETASLLANINSSIRGINSEIEGLAHANEEGASSILQMGSAIEQVARNAATLQESVESSTSSVHEMGTQIQKVAESSDSVKQMAEDTAAAISEMDHSLQEVGEHVRSASELTERVSQSAEEGSQAVGATIDGIASIRKESQGAKQALEGLDQRIGEIGEIATVIGGISDETNLLSLNAAIIAAQAGEHGRAFAVVAEQVKTLARRTTESAKQIEQLIQSVQGESKHAVAAMAAGIKSVEEGVSRSRGAGAALEVIRTAAGDANGRVSEIARAAEEQARNSRHVSDAARQTSEHVQQISTAMAEQAQASERILANASQANELCRQMSAGANEQRNSSRYISTNISSITEMIRSIQQNTASHEKASQAVARTVNSILANARKSAENIPQVGAAVERLRGQATAVAQEVSRFEGAAEAPSPSPIALSD